jgi:hypothetical protein
LLAGLISLFVFHEVARLYLSPKAVPIAFILFSLSRSLVYYSSEAKQYSTDVLVTLVLLQFVFKLSKDPPSRQRLFEASFSDLVFTSRQFRAGGGCNGARYHQSMGWQRSNAPKNDVDVLHMGW